jgi:UDP:flavonoid glycosyltransferase YjiC (YdhE family)
VGASARILFVSSNGTGLGHLTRSLAIAKRLGPELEPLFLTLSAAGPVVRGMGYPVEYVASYSTTGAGNEWRWSRRLRGRLRAAIAEAQPAAVVFDGTHPYEALLGAMRGAARVRSVWCRRALWQRGADRTPLGRAAQFDAVLEPGELAAGEDRGPTVVRRDEAHPVAPIVLLDRDDLLPRDEAERALGLAPGRTNVLVALGQGEEVREANARCLHLLAGREGVQVAALSSALDRLGEVPDGVVHLEATYPMSRYYAAFDAAVAAAGYNAYHELITLGVPSLFVPMRRETDDQPARARYAQRSGIGLGIDSATDPALTDRLAELLDPTRREAIASRINELNIRNGAGEAASWLTELALKGGAGGGAGEVPYADASAQRRAGTSATGNSQHGRENAVKHGLRSFPGADVPGRRPRAAAFARRWATFLKYAPRTAYRMARHALTAPKPRTVVLAFGLAGDGLVDAVRAAIAESPDPAERTLVVTDALEPGPLLALGCGAEHVPAAAERQAELAGGDYEAFARRRIDLILAERPRPKRVVTAPGARGVPSTLNPLRGGSSTRKTA